MVAPMTPRPHPWNRALTWPEVLGGERRILLSADADTRTAVAKSLGLADLASLTARITVTPWLDGIEVTGEVEAAVTQTCGISLEPFDAAVDEPLRLRIVPRDSPNAPRAAEGEVVIDLDAEDPPDELEGESIDLAAYVVEALALALDPFPRKPGAVFSPPESVGPSSPFAVLSRLSKTDASE